MTNLHAPESVTAVKIVKFYDGLLIRFLLRTDLKEVWICQADYDKAWNYDNQPEVLERRKMVEVDLSCDFHGKTLSAHLEDSIYEWVEATLIYARIQIIAPSFGFWVFDALKEIKIAHSALLGLTGEEIEAIYSSEYMPQKELTEEELAELDNDPESIAIAEKIQRRIEREEALYQEHGEPPEWVCQSMTASERLKAIELLMTAKRENQPLDLIQMLEMMLCLDCTQSGSEEDEEEEA